MIITKLYSNFTLKLISKNTYGYLFIADPCEGVVCGPNAQCMLLNNEAKCLCRTGYTGTPGGCVDIDECQVGPCPVGAVCNNEPGSYSCQCPGGATGDPYKDGCSQLKVRELQSLLTIGHFI